MKLQEIVDMMDIKVHQEAWSVNFLIKKAGSGESVNQKLAEIT